MKAAELREQTVDELRGKGVLIKANPPAENSPLLGALFSWLPMLIILGIWIFVMRQMQGSRLLFSE